MKKKENQRNLIFIKYTREEVSWEANSTLMRLVRFQLMRRAANTLGEW